MDDPSSSRSIHPSTNVPVSPCRQLVRYDKDVMHCYGNSLEPLDQSYLDQSPVDQCSLDQSSFGESTVDDFSPDQCPSHWHKYKWRSLSFTSPSLSLICFTICLLHLIGAVNATRCYSCTSQFIGSSWDAFQWNKIFELPESFTDDCATPEISGSLVRSRQCDGNFNCVAFIMYFPMGRGGRGHVRGCWDSVFRRGFNLSGPGGAMKYSEFCGTYNMTTLRRSTGDQYHDQVVRACSCRGELCNSGMVNGHSVMGYTVLMLAATAVAHTLMNHLTRL